MSEHRLSLAANDPNPSTAQLLAYEQETSRLLREKGARLEAAHERLRADYEVVALERSALYREVVRWRHLAEMVDAHYSGSLDHQPGYVRAIRSALDDEIPA